MLTDEALWEYCNWSAGLTEAQRGAWDEFVATLKPAPDLVQQIQRFAFSTPNGNAGPAAEPPIVLIGALNAR